MTRVGAMEEWGALAIVWSGAVLALVLVVALSRRARRHGGSLRAGVVGAMYEWQSRDKQKALEIIVDGKAAARDQESPDGNLPELEGTKKDTSSGGARPERSS